MIIDVHTHIEDYNNEGFDHRDRISDMKRFMKQAGIDKAIILQDIDLDNPLTPEQTLDLIKDNPDLYMMTTVPVTDRTVDDIKTLAEILKHDKVVGVKLYPGYEDFYPNNQICDPIYDLCAENDKPVMFHTGDTVGDESTLKYAIPLHIDELAKKRPTLNIVIAHLGCPFFDFVMPILTNRSNVFADISGLTLNFRKKESRKWHEYAKQGVEKVLAYCEGDNKLMFGTDWFSDDDYSEYETFMEDYVKFVKSFDLTLKERNEIFYQNAMELFNIK